MAFAANRCDQSAEVVEPWLNRSSGSIVVADRHIGSGLAYQMLDGLDGEWLMAINRNVRLPDLVLFVDTPPEMCRRRMGERGASRELFEERLPATREAFAGALQLLQRIGIDVQRIDGSLDADDVCSCALQAVERILPEALGSVATSDRAGA
ncbi:MAG: hypothetical protein U5R31_16670 [Acidimicrobiia bacterium]|nr:hypothetical protein [Acidimicrobiia bacterium]